LFTSEIGYENTGVI